MEWFKRLGYALLIAVFQIILLRFGKFDMVGGSVIFLLLGGLISLMGHKRLGYGIFLGTLIFAVVALLFGYLFMEGWQTPEEYWNSRK